MRRDLMNFIVLTVAIFSALYFSGPASNYAALRDRGKETSAVITSSACNKSLEFHYSFMVVSRAYVGGASVIGCDRFARGSGLQIVYLPDDPTTNYYGNPAVAYTNDIRASLLAAFILSGGITVALYLRRAHAKRAA